MNSGLIAARYARALFDVALERGVEQQLFSQFHLLEQEFDRLPELFHALENPKVHSDKKRQLLLSAIGTDPSSLYCRLVAIMVENRRGDLMRSVALLYMDLYRQRKGIKYVELTLAHPVEEQTREEIVALVVNRGDELELKVTIDSSIVGGFILREGVRRLDASVRTSLRNISRVLTEKNKKRYV